MKKILALLALFVFSFTNIYALSQTEEKVIDIFIQKIENLAEKKGNIFRIAIKQALEKELEKKSFPESRKEIVEKVIENLDENIEKEKIKLEKAEQIEQTSPQPSPVEERELEQKEAQEKYGINFDFEEVKNYWLELTNKERKLLGLTSYGYSKKLEETAQKWSETQKGRGKWTHERTLGDGFYNYAKINSWFKQNGVVCKNVNRVTFTENVGNRGFTCKNNNCTDEVKKAVKNTFDFYMSEKGKSYAPHYKSIVNKYFNYIGFGISFAKKGNNYYKYYLTVHYCTELVE